MEQFSQESGVEGGLGRERLDVVAPRRFEALQTILDKVPSANVIALVAALCGPAAFEADVALADTREGMSTTEQLRAAATLKFNAALRSSRTQAEFAANMADSFESLGDEEKIMALGVLGGRLGALYDFDMLGRNEHVAITSEEMFSALKYHKGTVGICGNIHSEIEAMTENLGMKGVLMSGMLPTGDGGYGGHVYSMVYADLPQSDGSIKEEIAIINYNSVIRTGTDNLTEAIGVYEMKTGVPSSFFGEHVQLSGDTVVPIQGHASTTFTNLARMDKPSRELLQDDSEQSELAEPGYSFNIKEGTESVTLTGPVLSFSLAHFENLDDPFNSINTATSVTGGLHREFSVGAGELSTDFKLNFTHAELRRESVSDATVDYVALQMVTQYQSGRSELMESAALGTLSGQFAAAARIGIAIMSNGDKSLPIQKLAPSGVGDFSMQYTAFLNKGSNELYLTMGVQADLLHNNFQEQEMTLHAGGYFTLGIDTNLIDAEVSRYTDGVRTDDKINLSIDINDAQFGLSYENKIDAPGVHSETFNVTATKDAFGGKITFGAGQEGASLLFTKNF